MKRLFHGTTIVVAVLASAGCTGLGNREFACPGYPGKPLCLPTSAIYRLTDGSGPPPARMTHSKSEQAPRDIDPFFPEGTP
jgi:hypothetical protein